MHSFYTFSSLIYYFQEVPLLKTSSILDYGLVGKKKKKTYTLQVRLGAESNQPKE